VTLAETASRDLSRARLVEGHLDALAILAEAGRSAPEGSFGVWAAGGPAVKASDTDGGFRLEGRKPWCSGASVLDRALVTAATSEGDLLFEVDLRDPGVVADEGSWPSVGMAGSDTLEVTLDIEVGREAVVGDVGWYTGRAGFWIGSIGVAACWLGGAIGAVRSLAGRLRDRVPDPHQLAALGAAAARCAALATAVERCAAQVDARPEGPGSLLAREIRQAVEEGCLEVLVDVARAGGADHVSHDAEQSRRLADLPVYVRQHHGGRDAAAYGAELLDSGIFA
jgi:alkylation response protein AidB-like acyl-CoA dehydrogenase